ncbi:MAG: GNAT family N-acetyltransferase [Anaerolineae bacterium]|nr:GNAT family N-acetyltransferase [Anaerolineae bacterium]
MSDPSTPVFRPAQPTPQDAAAFFALAETAGEGIWTLLFGARAAHIVQSLFLLADNEISHARTLFAEVDGQVAGMLHRFPGDYVAAHHARTNQLYRQHIGPLHMLPFLLRVRRYNPLLGFIAQIPTDAYFIEMLALHPQFRGRGLGKALLDRAEAEARAASCARLELDVREGNDTARRLYEKFGFGLVRSSPTVMAGGQNRQLHRMAKPLA